MPLGLSSTERGANNSSRQTDSKPSNNPLQQRQMDSLQLIKILGKHPVLTASPILPEKALDPCVFGNGSV